MEKTKNIRFHSLDALRFFAFFKVFIFHVPFIFIADSEPFKQWYSDHIRHSGGTGVSFFFVLSGFLITYILTREKMTSGSINMKRFFVYRAFRIWPLFYLAVIFALAIPYDFAQEIGFHTNWGGYDPDWRFSLTFTENYKSIIMDRPPKTTPLPVLWSLCIGVHFYLVWMMVFFILKRKFIPYFLVFSVILAWIFRIYDQDIYGNENITNNELLTNLDYFSVSGILGYMVAVNYERVANFVRRIPNIYKVIYVTLLILMLLNLKAIFMHDSWFLSVFRYTINAIVFTLLLLLFIPQDGKWKISDSNVFSKLGKMGYGLYVYHIVWIHVILRIYRNKEIVLNNWADYGLFVLITLTGTIITSYISYHYFEIPIWNLRKKLFTRKQ